jgi:antitoxin ParD1/3/4
MAMKISVSLGDHFEGCISKQIESGCSGSASEVTQSSPHIPKKREQKIGTLRQALIDGENRGDAGELDMDETKSRARRRAELD